MIQQLTAWLCKQNHLELIRDYSATPKVNGLFVNKLRERFDALKIISKIRGGSSVGRATVYKKSSCC